MGTATNAVQAGAHPALSFQAPTSPRTSPSDGWWRLTPIELWFPNGWAFFQRFGRDFCPSLLLTATLHRLDSASFGKWIGDSSTSCQSGELCLLYGNALPIRIPYPFCRLAPMKTPFLLGSVFT